MKTMGFRPPQRQTTQPHQMTPYQLIGKIKSLKSPQLEKTAIGVKLQMLIHDLVTFIGDGAVSAEIFSAGLHTGLTVTNGMIRNNPNLPKLLKEIKSLASPRYQKVNIGTKQQVLANLLLSYINNPAITNEVFEAGFNSLSDELLKTIDK